MSALDNFGVFIVKNLRDRTIDQHEMLQDGKVAGDRARDIQHALSGLPTETRDLIRRIVIDAIDTAMHDILFAFQDSHDRGLGIDIMCDGVNVAKESGMLQGEIFGDRGWIGRFSKYPA